MKYDLPDDMLLGLILGWENKIKLTKIKEFHSHLEILNFSDISYLKSQVLFLFNYFTFEIKLI